MPRDGHRSALAKTYEPDVKNRIVLASIPSGSRTASPIREKATVVMKQIVPLIAATALVISGATAAPRPLQDKTLVVWVAPANLTQQGGSALTIDDGQSHFDGIVFGEITPRKWMAGSDGFRRTMKNPGN